MPPWPPVLGDRCSGDIWGRSTLGRAGLAVTTGKSERVGGWAAWRQRGVREHLG